MMKCFGGWLGLEMVEEKEGEKMLFAQSVAGNEKKMSYKNLQSQFYFIDDFYDKDI